MILQGSKKRILKEIVRYYTQTLGVEYSVFLQALWAYMYNQLGTEHYADWLAHKCIELLGSYGITPAMCIENKDQMQVSVAEDKSAAEGEYYTPEVWCKTGRDYLKEMLGDLYGKANIWDASAGTGNLLRTADYPQDKLYISTLLDEDVKSLRNTFPNATVFSLDFVNGLDYDENNMDFSSMLPDKLKAVLTHNEPIVFFMNPPYKTGNRSKTDMGTLMFKEGMNRCASDLFFQFLYRILLLKETYKLTNVYIGLYSGTTFMLSPMFSPILSAVKEHFAYDNGFLFLSNSFTNTSYSLSRVMAFTCWKPREKGMLEQPFRVDVLEMLTDDTVSKKGEHILTMPVKKLSDWVQPTDLAETCMLPVYLTNTEHKSVMTIEDNDFAPDYFQYRYPSDDYEVTYTNALGQMCVQDVVLQGVQQLGIVNGAGSETVPITQENFLRVVASYTSRMCYKRVFDPYNNWQYFSAPTCDFADPEFKKWVYNGVVLFLMDWANFYHSFRKLKNTGGCWSNNNPFFPLSKERVVQITTDEKVLKDLAENPYDNSFILSVLEDAKPYFIPEIQEFYDFCIGEIETSLSTDWRKKSGYNNSTFVWDAGMTQIRKAGGCWTAEKESKFCKLTHKVKKALRYGIYKFGFLKTYDEKIGILENKDEEMTED